MEALKQYLVSNSIPQSAFAKQLGVSQPTVSDYVNGNMLPKGKRLKMISEITGLSVDQLLNSSARAS